MKAVVESSFLARLLRLFQNTQESEGEAKA